MTRYGMSMEVLGDDGAVTGRGDIGCVRADDDAGAVKAFDEIIANVDCDLERMYGRTPDAGLEALIAALGKSKSGRRFRAFLTDGGRTVAERGGGVP